MNTNRNCPDCGDSNLLHQVHVEWDTGLEDQVKLIKENGSLQTAILAYCEKRGIDPCTTQCQFLVSVRRGKDGVYVAIHAKIIEHPSSHAAPGAADIRNGEGTA